MSADPLVTVVTPTTGNTCVLRAIKSVADQSYKKCPASHRHRQAGCACRNKVGHPTVRCRRNRTSLCDGKRQVPWTSHHWRICLSREGDFFCYLDEDNWFDWDYVAALLEVVRKGAAWAYSLRKIVDRDGNFICNDDCESLGKWPSVLGPNDYLIDTNCYFLPRMAAVVSGPVWYRRFREPNTLDADRAIVHLLRAQNADYDSSRRYSVNYVSKTPLSLYAGISS